jgi:hypothetical protein
MYKTGYDDSKMTCDGLTDDAEKNGSTKGVFCS